MDWEKLLSVERIRKSSISDKRNEFESDYGRIIYSPALRRMHDKTQVFPLTTDDNIHSRLTHSNEVMSLGYTFGMLFCEDEFFVKRLGKTKEQLLRIIPIIIQNICLIHDIGNSPFGHFGETIISNYFKRIEQEESLKEFCELDSHQKRDFLYYDGNAQGLRVLTKLQILNDPYGLNLTYATLSSSLKYPNYNIINSEKEKELAKQGENLEDKFIECKKHGVFFSEKEYFDLIVENTGLKIDNRIIRHPLCYLMEAADSIAYYCMDMEDGFNKGIYTIDNIQEKFEEKKGIEICDWVLETINTKYVNDSFKIVNIRIKLIRYFVDLAFKNFKNNLDLIETGNYNKELVEDDPNKIFKIVEGFSKKIFKSREINNLESTGYSVIVGLLDFYIDFVFKKQNDKFISKAQVLISNSIIDAAIEETLIETCERKIQKGLQNLREKKKLFSSKNNVNKNLDEEIDEYEKMDSILTEKKGRYLELVNNQKKKYIESTSTENLELAEIRGIIYKEIKPDFKDLSNYFKFRVIVDFISGMTDQYAVKHFQRISGQRIN